MALASAAVRRPAIDVERIAGTAALVALLDGVFAVVFYVPLLHRTTALRLFQGIAASLLGRTAAFDGGIATGVMGVLMHVGVALGWTVVFALAYSRSEGLRRLLATMPGAIVTGMLYGCFIWLTMEYVIVQLTRTPPGHIVWTGIFIAMLAWHAVGIGLPIALRTRRA